MKNHTTAFLTAFLSLFLFAFVLQQNDKPTLFIIGDSTVKNGSGKGSDSLWGWGSVIQTHFDTSRLAIQNHAIGGRSSRTFITDGRWERILKDLKSGDYVIIQFGHNDGGALDDTSRARGTLRGIGDSSKTIFNPIRKVEETVHTYGWYMRQYVREAKAKGAIPIVCSLVPRNDWSKNKVKRANESYALWAKQIAEQEGTLFIDLNEKVAIEYEKMDEATVKNQFFPKDHTHTNVEGAKLNAQIVVNEIKGLKNYSSAITLISALF
jgi:rhamnogalacturonan acetylesterase